MIVEKHYENLKVLHENTMPARAYYIPASKRMDNLVREREQSDRFTLLNGNWKFKYYSSIYDLKDEFYLMNYDSSDFDEIKVPSAWQMLGYDCQQYTNVKYPIPFDPPYVPVDDPCGAYTYDFIYTENKNAKRAYLNFEGVDSAFYVWLNGQYIGYSQVPHMTSEFDITDIVKVGENRLAVLVMKWSDGTYLEDQDKFRMSGIIRDVYIIHRPDQFVYDYYVNQSIVNEKGENPSFVDSETLTGKVSIDFTYFDKAIDTVVSVFDTDGNVVYKGTAKPSDADINKYGEFAKGQNGFSMSTICFDIDNITLWNHENPYLYTIVIESGDSDDCREVIVDRIGFRKIEIKDSVFYLNGRKVKIRGVNRHESDPFTGPVTSLEQLIKDLTIIRQHNFTAIRTSHYPNVPYFYQLCDEYGFLVCDEADIEAHGPCELYRKVDTYYEHLKRWCEQISDDPAWEGAITDRVGLMLMRDKNRPCVIMWSMGNEAAYGCNFEKALKYTKDFDKSRITQYESSRYRNYDKIYDYSCLDLYSRMYPGFDEMDEYFDRDGSKPFMLIEYCHSMGNGPGDFEDYFEYIENNDKMMGGFIWEFCDHAIYKGKAPNGKDMYFYGGDHGEVVHDGNFCMDGLVYPDRTLNTGILEYKNVNRPARVVEFIEKTPENCTGNEKCIAGKLKIHNYLTYTNLEDFVNIVYEVSVDGNVIKTGNIDDFCIGPLSDGEIDININIPSKGKCFLRIIYKKKAASELVEVDYELGFDEIALRNEEPVNQKVASLLGVNGKCATNDEISFEENDEFIVLLGKDFTYRLSKKSGLFDSIVKSGVEYFDKPSEINVWRAPTDNDINIRNEWKKACYHMAYARAYETSVEKIPNSCADKMSKESDAKSGIVIKVRASVCAPTVQKFIDLELEYRINKDGIISSKINAKKNEEFPELPRFGVRMFLNKDLSDVSYYGVGPFESYVDKKRASYHGIFESTVKNMVEDYIRPQENGSHIDTDFVDVTGNNMKFTVASFTPFAFNVSPYTQEELASRKHNYELEECGSTVLCIDAGQNGIGSNSCGPGVLNKYKFDAYDINMEYSIVL